MVRGNGDATGGVSGEPVCIAGSLRHPEATLDGAQHWVEGGHEASGGSTPSHAVGLVGVGLVHIRLAVGDNDQGGVGEEIAGNGAEPLLGPPAQFRRVFREGRVQSAEVNHSTPPSAGPQPVYESTGCREPLCEASKQRSNGLGGLQVSLERACACAFVGGCRFWNGAGKIVYAVAAKAKAQRRR